MSRPHALHGTLALKCLVAALPVFAPAQVWGAFEGSRLSSDSSGIASPDSATPALIAEGTWAQVVLPERRWASTVIHDPVRNRMIIFGGNSGFGAGPLHNDVWALSLQGQEYWEELPAVGTRPSGRKWSAAVYDPVRDRMVLFGGYDGTYRDDVWALSLNGVPTWTHLAASGTPPPLPRWAHSAVYDAVGDRVIVFGGYSGAYLNDTWALSLGPNPTWTRLQTLGVPPPRREHTAILDPVHGAMLVYAGWDGTWRGDVWSLDLSTLVWTPLAPTGGDPPHRSGHSAVYDSRLGEMVIFGGDDGHGEYSPLDDSWALTLGPSPTWRNITPTQGRPFGRRDQMVVYDVQRDRLVMFGGGRGAIFYPYSDFWELSLGAEIAWKELGGPPPSRREHAVAYDPVQERMIVFGGTDGETGLRNDAWTLSLTEPAHWQLLAGSTGDEIGAGQLPDAREAHTVVYDSNRNELVLFGGESADTYLNDTWVLTLVPPAMWTQLSPGGVPPSPRSEHSAIFDPVGDRMIVFGGWNGAVLGDAWSLSLGVNPEWSLLSPAGQAPAVRWGHSAIYDPDRRRMLVYSGQGQFFLWPDLWALSLDDPLSWSQVTFPPPGPVPRRDHVAIYQSHRDQMVIWGGWNNECRSDAYAFDLGPGGSWRALSSGPPVRCEAGGIFDPVRDRMVIFGGSPEPMNEVWALNWEPIGVGVPGSRAEPGTTLTTSIPNPFRDETRIRLDLSESTAIRFSVYDVAGRLVRDFAARKLPSGSHFLTWDATDARGLPVGAGTYFYKIESDRETVVGKMVLLR